MWFYILIVIIVALVIYIDILFYTNKKLKDHLKIQNKEIEEIKKQINEKEIENDSHEEIIRDSLKLNVMPEDAQEITIDDEEKNIIKENLTEDEGNFENTSKNGFIDYCGYEHTYQDEIENEKLEEENENIDIIEKKITDINEEKRKLFEEMEYTNHNLFITGKAGTGKSYLLKFFRENTHKKVLYTAPTGIAALNIEGVTIHSAFGWNNLFDDAEINISNNKKELFRTTDTIIIDEISMVRVDVFNQIDKIMRYATGNFSPFGGKQLILMGDLFQLPPVAKKEEVEFFTDKYGGVFFFNSPAYKKGNFQFRELEEIFRQSEKNFIKILNDIRIGRVTSDDINQLNEHYVSEIPRRVVQVVPKKDQANNINQESINKIDSPLFTYHADILVGDKNTIKETDFPCDFTLKLKVGALVMMIINDPEYKRWVNGTLGIVSRLDTNSVTVTINGSDYEISPVPFNKNKCVYNRDEGRLEYVVESSVSQYPLILAYAITIHKSQGMTYQQIACNLDSCFAPGQAYVALSRCANFDKLYLTKKVDPKCIITDEVVANFYLSQKEEII